MNIWKKCFIASSVMCVFLLAMLLIVFNNTKHIFNKYCQIHAENEVLQQRLEVFQTPINNDL